MTDTEKFKKDIKELYGRLVHINRNYSSLGIKKMLGDTEKTLEVLVRILNTDEENHSLSHSQSMI